ncbi:MAG TPA: hypothetical protein VGQ17_14575 [Gemmatimonadales bacterium]|jgi:hypothetical protein|nr:hypothetical protein [Gemmatimonadales bacterium]
MNTSDAGAGARPWLVELVGPAGAGKSTISDAIPLADPTARDLSLWGLPRRFLLLSALALLPTLRAAALSRHRLTWEEIANMIRLGALLRTVRDAMRRGYKLILIDEGPIFALSWFEVNGTRNGERWWARWRDRVVSEWGALLDGIVRVDASDPVLARRIRTRPKPHPVKFLAERGVLQFEASFRQAFDRVVPDFVAARALPIRTLRTDGSQVDHSIRQLRRTIEEMQRGN